MKKHSKSPQSPEDGANKYPCGFGKCTKYERRESRLFLHSPRGVFAVPGH